jgi:hypothetical protein
MEPIGFVAAVMMGVELLDERSAEAEAIRVKIE